MTKKTRDEVQGYEYDWLACDQHGQVALLSTAGGGYAPQSLLTDSDAYDEAIDSILELPSRTVAKLAPEVGEGLPNTWRKAAERGLYAFDADPNGGAYRLVAIPTEPLLLAQLPSNIRGVVRQVSFELLGFDAVSELTDSQVIAAEMSI